ncbi:glycogen debranching protein GlgX [Permianibacter sp. IMCC34836]|uniref:glycogen debranching protein GlgX n=1 Tax=Permianibacter fluminis TaxID=2738515 RepID=UPI0015561386|nr:glycogen debranching protein GlgX [Permianibacter fluminis]NQD37501.1 glycogen debranching protein GlgX [Permianibacter fluminis]
MSEIALEVGRPYPLGATWEGAGVNFALFSEHAESVELCLFDALGHRETARIPLRNRTGRIWHCFLPTARPGTVYGYRVYGPYSPREGHRFNPQKLLLDPYAKALVGEVNWDESLFGYRQGGRQEWRIDSHDSQQHMAKCVVIDPTFNWDNDRLPNVPLSDTVLYELHVKGFTQLNSLVAPELRGKYLGLAAPAVIDYLKNLGVSTVELLPCQSFLSERSLVEKGLGNYWGYNPMAFFAPDRRYAIKDATVEFKTMVKKLHAAGIEVVMDIVFNHSAEGNELGPHLSFRGIDNKVYYQLDPEDARYYRNFSGCGNTLNAEHPQVLKLMMDCLRYWASEMHVDGFRFDLASCLARRDGHFDASGSFFNIIHQDPVLSHLKLMAEPWDCEPNGYQLGRFPGGWSEWNDKYRDNMRAFWRGEGGQLGQFAERLAGSSDLFANKAREPTASINFITAHDGFTLHDLVSYQYKHNEANLEDNRDGADHNGSWNCGEEGESDDPAVIALREQQKRNLLATLLLSQGVPIVLAGDEYGRSQGGNNNAYCQDNEVSWLRWSWGPRERELQAFVRRLIALRRQQPALRRRRFFDGVPQDNGERDVSWLRADGQMMSDADWHDWRARSLGLLLNGRYTGQLDAMGRPVIGDHLLILLNSHHERQHFQLPAPPDGALWELVFDTAETQVSTLPMYFSAHDPYPLQGRSFVVLLERVVQRDRSRLS